MLDDAEFAEVRGLYAEALRSLKISKESRASPDPPDVIYERLAPVREAYFRMTGYSESNAATILHHALNLYGPPCTRCARPLRTPRARHCAACGADAPENQGGGGG
jgi:hypothetical protein